MHLLRGKWLCNMRLGVIVSYFRVGGTNIWRIYYYLLLGISFLSYEGKFESPCFRGELHSKIAFFVDDLPVLKVDCLELLSS